MRYALVNDQRTEAESGLKGVCPGCRQPVTPKCGEQRIHHWAHSGKNICDDWWEPEKEWHRSWKNNYPVDWQEIHIRDETTGESHIADVRTDHGLILEFQHSHINPKERRFREQFYKNMVWVVDGTRLKRDFTRFLNGMTNSKKIWNQNTFLNQFPEKTFSKSWLDSKVPVIFDFLDQPTTMDHNPLRKFLWCLLPGRVHNHSSLVRMERNVFLEITIKKPQICIPSLVVWKEKAEQRQTTLRKVNQRTESQYYLEKGRFKKRKRF